MGSWWSFCSRREAVVTLWPDSSKRRTPIGVRLMMSSSAPPPRADRACTHLGNTGAIVAAKDVFVDDRFVNAIYDLAAGALPGGCDRQVQGDSSLGNLWEPSSGS